MVLFFQAEDGIRDLVRSRGLGDVYKRQVVGQVLKYTRGRVSVRTTYNDTVFVSREELLELNREKRHTHKEPYVKNCASTNFLSSPYALKPKELVYSTFIYGNSLEIGIGDGFSVKGLTSVVPIFLPTGYEVLYKKKLTNSNFSVGASFGQIWLSSTGDLLRTEAANSGRNFVNFISSSVTYHKGDAFLKSGITVFSGSTIIRDVGTYVFSSTYSTPGLKQPTNRWTFTLIVSPNTPDQGNGMNAAILAGHQTQKAKGSFTLGLGLIQGKNIGLLPFPYAYFSLYASKEQQKIRRAYNIHTRMRALRRYLIFKKEREMGDRQRADKRALRRQKRQEK